MRIFISTLVVSFLVMAPAFAQPSPEYSSDDFVRAILMDPSPCIPTQTSGACEAASKSRGFNFPSRQPNAKPRMKVIVAKGARPEPKHVSSSDVLVTFATGSAEITPQGKVNLKAAAAGLNTASLKSIKFEVAGFTDARGSQKLNADLSKKRAEAVKSYLLELDVSGDRLITAGYGSAQLANPDDPAAEENRRVEFRRLN